MLARAGLRYLLRHPWQLSLAVLGVAIGVAVVVAIDLANSSAHRAFILSQKAVSGTATHQLVGGPQGVPESIYRRLRVDLGVRASAPVVEARVSTLPGGEAPPVAMSLLGVDALAESELGRSLGAGSVRGDVARLVAEPGTAVLTADRARALGLELEDSLRLRRGEREFELTLVGIVEPASGLDREGLAAVVLTDVATAQEVLGREGWLSRVDMALSDSAAVARVEEALPPGLRLLESGGRSEALAQMTRAFRLNLTALSLLALMVGGFLIYNTLTFSVIQRRGLIGGLRALGVTRGEIFRLLLLEGALLGAVGSVLGVLLGIALGDGLLQLVSRTINDLYYAVEVTRLRVEPGSLLKGLALGGGASLLATAVPAYAALRMPPRGALVRSLLEGRVRRAAPPLAAGGLVLTIGAALVLGIPSQSLLLGFGGLFLLLLGFALLAPLFTIGLTRVLLPVLRPVAGLLGAMAARSIRTSLSRTGVAVAALAIAVSATVGVGIMIDSFRTTVVHWLDNTLRADIFVSPGAGDHVPLDPSWAQRLGAIPGVAYVSLGRRVDLETPQGQIQVFALRIPRDSFAGFDLKEGEPARAQSAFFEEEGVLVSEPFAYRQGLSVGDRVTLPTANGHHAFEVVGIYYDYGSDQGYVTLSRDTYLRHWEDGAVTSLGIYLQPGAVPEAVLEQVRARLAGSELGAISNRALRAKSLAIFDRTFTITHVLRMLAVLVAFAGILSALMAIQLERARELAVLRATGLTPRQLFALVTTETGLMGLAAGLLALPLGVLMSTVLVHIINRRSFGWSMQLQVDPGLLLQALGLAVLAALLAGLFPAWRMARTPPALALRNE